MSRLTPAERKHFKAYAAGYGIPAEPACGTLDDRLRILATRHGLRVGPIVLSKAEASQVEAARIVTPGAPVKRLNANERKIFRAYAAGYDIPDEPAVGTLGDRLAILATRHGASSARRVVLTEAERAEKESCRIA